MDRLLELCFKKETWEKALQVGVDKDIDRALLLQLTDPKVRATFYARVATGDYAIAPPHAQLIPKDKPGEFRTVYINEPLDRLFLSIVNNLLFELCSDMVHERCKSYQKGIGCGKVVQQVAHIVGSANGETIGWKSDLSKYFDSVPIEFIDATFDKIEQRTGKSVVIDIIREYYHQDLCFDVDGHLQKKYMSLMQGCAVAAFLADAVLYELDDVMSDLPGYYVRYSDDCLYVGEYYDIAMDAMTALLADKGLTLNPKKVQYLDSNHWFKFLGFSIKGNMISLSKGRLKTFKKEIESRTIKRKNTSVQKALNAVNDYMYRGDGRFSWATSVLPIMNCDHDILELDKFVMDAIRACGRDQKRRKIGGIGYEDCRDFGVVSRGTGRNVTTNRSIIGNLDGYYTIKCMQNVLRTSRDAYDTIVRSM